MNHKFSISLLLLLSASFGSVAQLLNTSTLNTTGGSASVGSNIYEWSVGEMTLVHTASSGSIIVTQGLLQTDKTNVGIKDQSLSVTELSVYPNPFVNNLFIEAQLNAGFQMEYMIYDVLGRQLLTKSEKSSTGQSRFPIDLTLYSSGSYYLNVIIKSEGKRYANTFEIKKIK